MPIIATKQCQQLLHEDFKEAFKWVILCLKEPYWSRRCWRWCWCRKAGPLQRDWRKGASCRSRRHRDHQRSRRDRVGHWPVIGCNDHIWTKSSTAVENTPREQKLMRSWVRFPLGVGLFSFIHSSTLRNISVNFASIIIMRLTKKDF